MQSEVKRLRNEAALLPRLQRTVKEKEDQIGDQGARISELSQMVSELEERRQGEGVKVQNIE